MREVDAVDLGVPDSAAGVFEFVVAAREIAKAEGGPIVVHCSAGMVERRLRRQPVSPVL